MNPINLEVGRKIKNFRKSKGMTLEQLAKEINKSKAKQRYQNTKVEI